MTQGIRLRQRALSSTGPAKVIRKPQNVGKSEFLSTDGEAMKACLVEINTMVGDALYRNADTLGTLSDIEDFITGTMKKEHQS